MEELSNFSLNLDVSLPPSSLVDEMNRRRERKTSFSTILLMRNANPSFVRVVRSKIRHEEEQSFINRWWNETNAKGNETKRNGWNKNTEV